MALYKAKPKSDQNTYVSVDERLMARVHSEEYINSSCAPLSDPATSNLSSLHSQNGQTLADSAVSLSPVYLH